jgi:hypothetical protein
MIWFLLGLPVLLRDDNEPAKVKLFLYLIGTRGREIYETMTFANAPENRTLLMVTEAFGDSVHLSLGL